VPVLWLVVVAVSVALIVWGAESFAENLARAAVHLGVGVFALALLLAGAEPEELATSITASLRGSPGIAIGDVVGANVAICLVALGVGALIAGLPFSKRVLWYAAGALPIGVIAVAIAWNGHVSRLAGVVLVLLYVGYVAIIWLLERAPPSLGEVGEVEEAREEEAGGAAQQAGRKIGREGLLVLAGVVAMVVGAWALVEAIRQLTGAQGHQTTLGLTLVGFATGFELVVLAWSASRRGASDVVVASVVGSFGYNVTMTLGAAAIVRPLHLTNSAAVHVPMLFMLAALLAVILLALPHRTLGRLAGVLLLAAYPAYLVAVLLVS